MFAHFITNWKTTLLGAGLFIVAVAHTLISGSIDIVGFQSAAAGLGLVVASDSKA